MNEFYEKISFALIDKSISFSPKIPYKLAAERSEAGNIRLRNPFWRCILKIARTEFCPRPASRASEWTGGQKRFRSEDSKLSKNLKTNRLEPYFGRAKEIFS